MCSLFIISSSDMLLALDVDPCLQRLSDSKCCLRKMLYGSCVCIQFIILCALGLSSVIDVQSIQLLTDKLCMLHIWWDAFHEAICLRYQSISTTKFQQDFISLYSSLFIARGCSHFLKLLLFFAV